LTHTLTRSAGWPHRRRLRTRIVRTFLSERFGASRINMARVKPEHVHRFVVSHLEGCKPSTGKVLGIALRSYLRFRGMHGDRVLSLIAGIPQIAQWRFESLPDTLSEAELERFLNAFDRKSAIGRRDYAMARCMVDLGLRAGEVASLQLDDLNWHDGTLRLQAGKARRTDVLPLPPRTGRAIAQYLTDGRPVSDSRAVFLRHRAPLIEPVGSSVVRNTVRAPHARCSNDPRRRGTHVLRHSVGGRLVQAGVPMKEIADILRRRCLDTTAIYTRIDGSFLRGTAGKVSRPLDGGKRGTLLTARQIIPTHSPSIVRQSPALLISPHDSVDNTGINRPPRYLEDDRRPSEGDTSCEPLISSDQEIFGRAVDHLCEQRARPSCQAAEPRVSGTVWRLSCRQFHPRV
jgi:integrase